MPIRMKLDGKRLDPRLTCDHCGQEIDKASDGCAVWRNDVDDDRGLEVFFTHRDCLPDFDLLEPQACFTGDLQSTLMLLTHRLTGRTATD